MFAVIKLTCNIAEALLGYFCCSKYLFLIENHSVQTSVVALSILVTNFSRCKYMCVFCLIQRVRFRILKFEPIKNKWDRDFFSIFFEYLIFKIDSKLEEIK